MTTKPDRQHVLGFAFIMIAVIMMAQGLWLQNNQNDENQCQADYNEAYTAVAKQRGDWADEDRRSLNHMIFTVLDPKIDNDEKKQVVTAWQTEAEKNDRNRKANPLPSRTDCG